MIATKTRKTRKRMLALSFVLSLLPSSHELMHDPELPIGAALTHLVIVQPLRRGVLAAVLAGLEL